MYSRYDKGDLLRATGTFRDLADALIDPTTVTFKAKNPAGTVTTRTYPTNVTRSSIGVFYTEWNLDSVGLWHLRVESTGTGQAAEETIIEVEPTAF